MYFDGDGHLQYSYVSFPWTYFVVESNTIKDAKEKTQDKHMFDQLYVYLSPKALVNYSDRLYQTYFPNTGPRGICLGQINLMYDTLEEMHNKIVSLFFVTVFESDNFYISLTTPISRITSFSEWAAISRLIEPNMISLNLKASSLKFSSLVAEEKGFLGFLRRSFDFIWKKKIYEHSQ